jgi:hypothetical protein
MIDWYLGGTKLCPYNFSFSEATEEIGGGERMLSGLMRRDIIAHKLSVKMSWATLPEAFDGTYHCYNDLRALGTKAGTMVFLRPVGTTTGTTSFNVFVSPPSGDVAIRLAGSNVWWDCSIQVVEA